MEVEAFIKVLKRRMWIYRILALISLILYIASFWMDIFNDFQKGGLVGIFSSSCFFLWYFRRILKNPQLFNKQYINETDEREVFINQKAGIPMINYFSAVLMALAIFLMGSYPIVAKVLLTVGCLQIFLAFLIRCYYSRTY